MCWAVCGKILEVCLWDGQYIFYTWYGEALLGGFACCAARLRMSNSDLQPIQEFIQIPNPLKDRRLKFRDTTIALIHTAFMRENVLDVDIVEGDGDFCEAGFEESGFFAFGVYGVDGVQEEHGFFEALDRVSVEDVGERCVFGVELGHEGLTFTFAIRDCHLFVRDHCGVSFR